MTSPDDLDEFPVSAPNGTDTVSPGGKERLEIETGKALRSVESALDELDVDQRTSMPNGEPNSHEYRLRDTRAKLKGLLAEFNELEPEGADD